MNNINSAHLSPQRGLPATLLTSAQAIALLHSTRLHRQNRRQDHLNQHTGRALPSASTGNSHADTGSPTTESSTSVVAYEDRMCRICRTGAADSPEAAASLVRSPCRCKGTVGYVHNHCLMRWQHVRQGARDCEICHSPYDFATVFPTAADQVLRRRRRLRQFLQPNCLGLIAKCLLNFVALSALTYLNIEQMQTFIEATGRYVDSGGGVSAPVPVVMMALYLMGVGVGNCTYVEWTLHTVHKIGLVLEHWWSRGAWPDDGDNDGNEADDALFGSSESLSWTFLGNVIHDFGI